MKFIDAIEMLKNNDGLKITNGEITLTWTPQNVDGAANNNPCLCVASGGEHVQIMPLNAFFSDEWSIVE
ncbi:hypothetical protein [Mixta calida]|uniref:hypothetical protein n=1 Tax=Mixta calida TaxID=665913 RepID=UPI0034D6292C